MIESMAVHRNLASTIAGRYKHMTICSFRPLSIISKGLSRRKVGDLKFIFANNAFIFADMSIKRITFLLLFQINGTTNLCGQSETISMMHQLSAPKLLRAIRDLKISKSMLDVSAISLKMLSSISIKPDVLHWFQSKRITSGYNILRIQRPIGMLEKPSDSDYVLASISKARTLPTLGQLSSIFYQKFLAARHILPLNSMTCVIRSPKEDRMESISNLNLISNNLRSLYLRRALNWPNRAAVVSGTLEPTNQLSLKYSGLAKMTLSYVSEITPQKAMTVLKNDQITILSLLHRAEMLIGPRQEKAHTLIQTQGGKLPVPNHAPSRSDLPVPLLSAIMASYSLFFKPIYSRGLLNPYCISKLDRPETSIVDPPEKIRSLQDLSWLKLISSLEQEKPQSFIGKTEPRRLTWLAEDNKAVAGQMILPIDGSNSKVYQDQKHIYRTFSGIEPQNQDPSQRTRECQIEEFSTPRTTAPTALLDLNRMSDQICSIIERKLKIERERRGMHG